MNLWTVVPLIPEGSQSIRAALLAVTADMPALRKLTQFLGHKATLDAQNVNLEPSVNLALRELPEE